MSKLQFKGDIVRTEKYNDKQTGEEKKKYINVGALFEREDGTQCINFLGTWLNIYPKKVDAQGYQQAKQAVTGQAPVSDDLEDSIPF